MSVCCECFVLTDRGLCFWLIIRPEESYRECVETECDCKASIMSRAWPTIDSCAMEKKDHTICIACIIFIQVYPASVLAHCNVFWYLFRDTPKYQNRS